MKLRSKNFLLGTWRGWSFERTCKRHQPSVTQAYEKFQQFNRDERLRILDEAHQQFLHDKATDIEEAHGKGKVEGKAERDIEIARSMKMKGLDYALIAEITGLSAFEIERLN